MGLQGDSHFLESFSRLPVNDTKDASSVPPLA